MHTFLYIIWALLPLFFFIMALWAKLEQISNKDKRQNPGDFFRQGLFVTACVIIAVLIDQTVLESFVQSLAPDFMPLGFFQIILLPIILLVAAKVYGPSKTIRITKPPHPSRVHRK